MRVRIAVCAFTLLALAGFHLQPSLADPTPPRPQAPYSAPVASSGPTAESGRAALVAAIRAAQEAQVAAWYTFWAAQPAPAPAPSAKKSGGTTAPRAPVAASYVSDGSVWDRIAACESGGNWAIATGNGYYGGLQMNMAFWHSYGGDEFAARPDLASREQQIIVAERARDSGRGYGPWPTCGRLA